MKLYKLLLLFIFILGGCVRPEIVPRCPFGVMYLTENDINVISDLLASEILEHNLYCEGLNEI